jgi:tripartite-type tricarboxylate transporter receptor subunit TctC
VPGYEGIGWQGIGAPKNTPTDIINKLNSEINAGLADPKLKARFADLGAETFANSPAQFGQFIADYTEKWATVIRAAGVKAE